VTSERPRLRPDLDAAPLEHEGVPLVVVTDPEGVAEPFIANVLQYAMLALCDGTRTRARILAELPGFMQQQWGVGPGALKGVPVGSVLDGLLVALDARHMLATEAARAAIAAHHEAFARAAVREAALAGSCYPTDPAALIQALDAHHADVPAPSASGVPRAILAPHIDHRVGGPTYAHAHAALGERPTCVVVLGIDHFSRLDEPFIATRKAFRTPLGLVGTDASALDALEAACGPRVFAGERAHRREHSIELQLPFLQRRFGADCPPIVPILCGGWGTHVRNRTSPRGDAAIARVIEWLAELVRARTGTLILASVDLSHFGPKFGDDREASPKRIAEVEAVDRELIGLIERGDAEGFWSAVAREGNATHVCGYPAIYATLAALGPRGGRLLHYAVNREAPTRSAVSFCAMAYGE